MTNKITSYIDKFVKLTEEEKKLFSSCFKEEKIKKRQFIVQPNFIAKHRHYVLQGAFRAYVVADEGQEHTITFAILMTGGLQIITAIFFNNLRQCLWLH